MSDRPMESGRVAPQNVEDLLVDLARASSTPSALARKHNMALQELAHWSSSSCALPALHALKTLADAQAGLIISRTRAQAAKRLLRIANDRENPETARKACIDLLNVKTASEAPPSAAAVLSSADHAGVLESLERLGRTSEPRRPR
ncbi:MAG: hypothetical protein ACF8GE_10935 [Phycisphaerales bacterium JB043]